MRDVLAGTLKQPAFATYLQKLRGAATEPITADPIAVVEVTAKKFRFTDPEKNSFVLRHFLGGHNHRQELTKYGLIQAVTRASQDIDDYDPARPSSSNSAGRLSSWPRASGRPSPRHEGPT